MRAFRQISNIASEPLGNAKTVICSGHSVCLQRPSFLQHPPGTRRQPRKKTPALINGFRRVASRQTPICTHGNDIRTFLPSLNVRQTLWGRMCSEKPLLPSLSLVLLKCSPDAGDKKARGELERQEKQVNR